MTKPLKCRKLQAAMKLKEISLSALAKRAGFNLTTTSQVLNGRIVDPLKFAKLSALIERAPTPPDPVAA